MLKTLLLSRRTPSLFAARLFALSATCSALSGCGTSNSFDSESVAGRAQALSNYTAVFQNTSTMRDGAADWDGCHGKASCAAGETITGISEVPAGYGRTGLCKAVDTSTYSGTATATLTLDAGVDQRRAQRLGDWAPNYLKLECGTGEYVSGVSENANGCQGNNRFHAVRCSQGSGLGDVCSTRAFDSADSRGTTASGDWDYGAYKGECADDEYTAGVSVSPSTGRPHSLLCCKTGAAVTCPVGQTLLDGTTCVTLTLWSNQTALPDGSQIAIRLRKVMINYTGGSTDWPKWLGLADSDNQTLDAVDIDLKSRDLFTVSMFWPAGEQYYDLPWYNMLAANGMYVGGNDGTGQLKATRNLADSGTFGRGWSDASRFLLGTDSWSNRQARLNQVKQLGNYKTYCQSPHTLGTAHITQFLNGGYPYYGCYVSGYVDFFVVTF